MSSAPKWMSARLEKNLPTALKKLEMSSPSEARGTRSSLGGRRLAAPGPARPRGPPAKRPPRRPRASRPGTRARRSSAPRPPARRPRPVGESSSTAHSDGAAPERHRGGDVGVGRRLGPRDLLGRSRSPRRRPSSPADAQAALDEAPRREFETRPTGIPAARRAPSSVHGARHRLDARGDLLEDQRVELGVELVARDAEHPPRAWRPPSTGAVPSRLALVVHA